VVSKKGSRFLSVISDTPIPLRKHPIEKFSLTPFLSPSEWPPSEQAELPRALKSLAQIIDNGLCHRCGTCVGICPTKVLGRDEEEYPVVKDLNSCTDCDLCVKVCPGDEFDLLTHHQEVFKRPAEVTATHGYFERSVVAHATDPEIRERSTSGGLVTAILLDLLSRGEIHGAVTVGSHESILWMGSPILARTREDIISTMKSKYAISPTNSVLDAVRDLDGKVAVVGLPCQIHGILKAKALDSRLRDKITFTIGLFCHAAIEHEAFSVIWETLGVNVDGAKKFISRVGKHPGSPHIERKNGSLYPVYFGSKFGYRPSSIEVINILYRLYTPSRCLTCFDATSEFADISVGDPWMAPPNDSVNFYDGWSFGLIRTAKGTAVYDRLVSDGKLKSVEVSRDEALASNRLMANEKRWRAFRVIETHRRQGKSIPDYGMFSPPHSVGHFVKTELHMLSHFLCYVPSFRAGVLRFMLGNGGYVLFWLNHKRRSFRFWRRDKAALLRRRWREWKRP
jgi:coenzyme F420 hydrogenase subunit beta